MRVELDALLENSILKEILYSESGADGKAHVGFEMPSFESLDLNHDGVITRDEWNAAAGTANNRQIDKPIWISPCRN